MANGQKWKGKKPFPDLKDAVQEAWDEASAAGAGAGTFKLEIYIEADNPIRSYIVTITPGSP